MAVVARCAAARSARDAGDDVVGAWLEHRNDTSALQSLTRQGYVVDTMEIAAPWSRLAALSTDVRERAARRAPRPVGELPSLAQLLRRRLPLLHLPRPTAARPDRDDLRRHVGRRPAGGARRRRQPVAPPRRRDQPVALRGRGVGRGRGGARRDQARPRPPWHPQPRQARPALAVRPERRGRECTERRDGTGRPFVPARRSRWCSPCRWRSPPGSPPIGTTTPSPSGCSIGATLGFLVGAGCAAWVQRVGFPLSHGLVTAGGTYAAAQAVFITVRLRPR